MGKSLVSCFFDSQCSSVIWKTCFNAVFISLAVY